VAGLFDGEGCIDVQRMYPSDGKGRFYVRPRVRICMSNVARGVIYKLHASFGGHVTTRPANGLKQQSSLSVEWLNDADIRSILSLIVRHLELKTAQAKLVLWWLDNAKGRQTNAAYPGMEKAREAFAEELREMKRDPNRSTQRAIQRITTLMRWREYRREVQATVVTKVCKKTGYAYPSLRILAEPNYLTSLQKLLGGRLRTMEANPMWVVSLSDPQRIEQILKHCEKHLGQKWGAALFLLMCAKAGNLRDGKVIHEAIKVLNAQPYDSSKSDLEVERWLQKVRFDLPKRPQGRPTGIIEVKPRCPREPTGLREERE
jgi:vacuolar-type H+-ATPase subunit E/Vma4